MLQFGAILKKLRTAAGLTLKDLGDALGTTPQHICNMENGRNLPSWEAAGKLADRLGVSLDTLRVYTKVGKNGKKASKRS